jgi:ribonucleotide reductase alpha subunit
MTDHTLIAPEWLSQEAMQTLSAGYLLPGETPRAMFERVASAASKLNDDEPLYDDIFECLWNGWLGLSSPVAANFGAPRSLPISCYSVEISNSIPSIFSHLKEVAMLSKNGGGVGVYFGNIQPAGAPISDGGVSLGKTAWMEGYDWASSKVGQGGNLRKGSFALYSKIDDPDYPEILRAKDHTKGDSRSWLDSNLGAVISDEFMDDMIENGGHKQWLFGETIRTRLMTGSPYMLFTGNVNRQNPDCYKERNLDVKFSNLCFTADTLVAVADGRNSVPIGDLVNTSFPVYSAYRRTHQTAASKSQWVTEIKKAVAFKTGTQKVIEVELEDGSTFKCTPDHLLARRDGLWVEAQHSVGEILEPFTSFKTTSGRIMTNPTVNGHNRLDSYVLNEDVYRGEYEVRPGAPVNTSREQNEQIRSKVSEIRHNGICVTGTRSIGVEDVYDLRVEDNHNFFIVTKTGDINSGVLVHNCSEITLYTDENHSFVCVLSSLNLSKWFEWRDWRSHRTGRSVPEIATHLLEAVVSEFIKKAENKVGLGRAVRFAKKSRALGLGTMGLHSLYQSQGLPFKSAEARTLNIETHKFIREQAEKASKELAERFGEPEWCVGSGRRHTHLLAIAPTKTNSVISGSFSEGISPMDYNYYVAKQDKGAFVRKNPHLERIFLERNISPTVWDDIDKGQGSVQGLECLTDHEKDVFKTAREIDQFELIKQAADRQPHICQAQSLNVWVDPYAEAEYLLRLHISAYIAGVKSLYYLKSKSALISDQDEMDDDCEEPAIVITKDGCPYCSMLKERLTGDGIDFIEVNKDLAVEEGMWMDRWKTVPQLYLDNMWVGGYTDYMALNRKTTHQNNEIDNSGPDCTACEA